MDPRPVPSETSRPVKADNRPWRREQQEPPPPPLWKTEGVPREKKPPQKRRRVSPFLILLLLFLVMNLVLSNRVLGTEAPVTVSYTFFDEQVKADNVESITSTAEEIDGTFRTEAKYPPDAGQDQQQQVTRFMTQRPSFADDDLFAQLQENDVTIDAENPNQGAPVWQQLLVGILPTLLIFGLIFFLIRRAAAGMSGGLGGLGKSKAKRYEPEGGPRTTFADVAGIDEVQSEVEEIVDFLRHPERYRALGARTPKGVLLSGQPGTGKTLLARAVAGEADVPFFSIAASEFIEMVVGVGASRVRDLFVEAKKVAPSILFIDELDAIGRSRGGSAGFGGNDEREQTLNQILTEMDGFTGNEDVIVLAATNRPEVLDAALLRPGRFDRRVSVSPPDAAGRIAILKVHARDVPLADDVDLDALAATTPGMVGADLRNLINEGALTAARRHHTEVLADDLADALEKIQLGGVRGIVLAEGEKERTAVHESGHALLGMLTPGADPVRRISIIPRGMALGVTFQTPEGDRYGYSAEYLRGRIVGALGGRAAEEVVYGDMTTGAESDLEQCTRIARQMVGRWGMSDAIGPVSVLPAPGSENPFGSENASPATQQLVDEEVRTLIEECHEQACHILRKHRDQLDALSVALYKAETLDEEGAYAAAGITRAQAPGARARGEAPGTEPAPGMPPEPPLTAG